MVDGYRFGGKVAEVSAPWQVVAEGLTCPTSLYNLLICSFLYKSWRLDSTHHDICGCYEW